MPDKKAYEELQGVFEATRVITTLLDKLDWDGRVIMPGGGLATDAAQKVYLNKQRNDILTDPRLPELIAAAKANPGVLSEWERKNLELMELEQKRATAIPKDLFARWATIRFESYPGHFHEWKEKSDFDSYCAQQQKMLEVTREVSAARAAVLGMPAYDTNLDRYSVGFTATEINDLFSRLKDALKPISDEAITSVRLTPRPAPFSDEIPFDRQYELNKRVAASMGFDFGRGTLHTAGHPFSCRMPGDTRLTTAYHKTEVFKGIIATIHEMGHGFLNQYRPKEWQWQPVGGLASLAIDEAMALIIEKQVGRSDEFYKFLLPVIKDALGGSGSAWTEENFRKQYNRVEPSPIRIYADEVTYPLHVIMRYEMEQDMINGKMQVKDLPERWRHEMKTQLGIDVPNHAQGCMQDAHWMDGSFGYFPSYTLGALAAAQLMKAAREQDPSIMPEIARGNFQPLLTWLTANIYSKAASKNTNELMREATGKNLDINTFVEHVERRYLGHGNYIV